MNRFRSPLHTWRALAHRHRARLLLLTVILILLALTTLGARAQEASGDVRALRDMVPEGPILVRGPVQVDLTDQASPMSQVDPTVQASPVEHAVAEYRQTGTARTIRQSSAVVYPFGHSQPTLTCAPLRACVIELEEGEALLSVIAGDTERWMISEAYAGEGGATPLVVVKPTGHDLTTNLVLATDRRLYELTLDAPPQAEATLESQAGAQAEAGAGAQADSEGSETNPQSLYARRIQFYYPDDMVRALRQRKDAFERAAASTTPLSADFRLENLNFNYRILPGKGFPFEPEQVFDDGVRTYIKLPASARSEVLPVLFTTENGERQILNYAVRAAGEGHHYYITDRVIRQGVLVLGVQKKNWLGRTKHRERRLTLVNLDRP